ncbi:hypothetical protein Nepgr_025310 [Nepenthes gracilis]|uniref:BHLH domain-containing protein n=1 Tax=Nepenthes gracilis TaxID=150966 RepID=A0AAD3T671_NEPGR|nr:hypothetical protein Nepgr_025310 [Nepenthes gracilis]
MAAFSYQHDPFHVDSFLLPITCIKMPSILDEPNDDIHYSSFISQFYSSGHLQDIAIDGKASCVEQGIDSVEVPAIEKQGTDNSCLVDDHKFDWSGEQATQNRNPMGKKRKAIKEGSSSNSANSEDVGESEGKKHKKCNGMEEKKHHTIDNKRAEMKEKNAHEEAPTGYIHVKARRGQATDRHSLAERARREKISERMKLLQALVPGCDKATGKALMLDEIISYVQILQNQVQFLSMKLASLNPMLFYNLGVEAGALKAGQEEKGGFEMGVLEDQRQIFTNQSEFGGCNLYSSF